MTTFAIILTILKYWLAIAAPVFVIVWACTAVGAESDRRPYGRNETRYNP